MTDQVEEKGWGLTDTPLGFGFWVLLRRLEMLLRQEA